MVGKPFKNTRTRIWPIILRTLLNSVLLFPVQPLRREGITRALTTTRIISPLSPGYSMVSFPDSFFRGNSGFQQYNQRFNRPNTAYFRGTYQVPGNNVICLYCQLPGHFARFCPYTNQQQRGRPATAPESTVTSDADTRKQ